MLFNGTYHWTNSKQIIKSTDMSLDVICLLSDDIFELQSKIYVSYLKKKKSLQ